MTTKRVPIAERLRQIDARAQAAAALRAELQPGDGLCPHLYLKRQCPFCVIEELRRDLSAARHREASLRTEVRRLRARLGDA